MESRADPPNDQRVATRIEPDVRVAVREATKPGRVEELQDLGARARSALDLRLEAVPQEQDEIGGANLLHLLGRDLQVVRLRPGRSQVLHVDSRACDLLSR